MKSIFEKIQLIFFLYIFLILTCCFLQRGDVERGEEEEETVPQRGRRDSQSSQRSRPLSTARPLVSKIYFSYRFGLPCLLLKDIGS